MTEAELLGAGLGRGMTFDDEGTLLEVAPTGVPVAMHAELRELRELVEAVALQVAVLRELAELTASILGVVLEGEGSLCDDCGRADGSHADGVEH